MLSFLLSIYGLRLLLSGFLILGAFIIQIKYRRIDHYLLKKILLFSLVGILILLLYEANHTYKVWYYSDIFRFFLPPYMDISYFASKFLRASVLPWVIAAVGGLVLSWIAHGLNQKFQERFFEREEITLFALGAFLSGYPGILFYLLAVIIAELVLSIIYTVAGWGRAPMYYLWLPAALSVIIMMYIFSPSWVLLLTI